MELSWSEGLEGWVYLVRAVGDLGLETHFQLNETSLEAALPCGQTYTLTVQVQGDVCDSPVSQPALYRTGTSMPGDHVLGLKKITAVHL